VVNGGPSSEGPVPDQRSANHLAGGCLRQARGGRRKRRPELISFASRSSKCSCSQATRVTLTASCRRNNSSGDGLAQRVRLTSEGSLVSLTHRRNCFGSKDPWSCEGMARHGTLSLSLFRRERNWSLSHRPPLAVVGDANNVGQNLPIAIVSHRVKTRVRASRCSGNRYTLPPRAPASFPGHPSSRRLSTRHWPGERLPGVRSHLIKRGRPISRPTPLLFRP
jgi:hypothetical protein